VRAEVLPRLRAELDTCLSNVAYPRIGSRLYRLIGVFCQPQIVVTGSTAMMLQGIDVNPGDVDIYVRPSIFHELKLRGWAERWPTPGDPSLLEAHFAGTRVHAWKKWNDRHYILDLVGFAFENVVIVNGWPCISLPALRTVKMGALDLNPNSVRHRKHAIHVEMIDRHLERRAA
jgi:hypothetical protein